MLRILSCIPYHVVREYDAIIPHDGMPKLKPGDTISCRVKSALIVSPYRSYDEIKTFTIIASDDHGYYLYVPHYYCLKGCVVADQYRCKKLGIDKKYIGEDIIHIQENMIASVDRKQDGIVCKICREFFPYAAANQEDGTLICFSCRQNPYH